MMPTQKKRVNLALSEQVDEKLQRYKAKNGISSDAGACVMLITRQLDAIEENERMLQMLSKFTPEELQQLSNIGVSEIIAALRKNKAN